jgi:endonuclease III
LSERRDFWNRVRVFPPEVAGWRKRLLRNLRQDPGRFLLASGLSPDQVQESLDAGISYLREVARILAVLYGTPDLGNKPEAVDELVYIILARKTREGAYQRGFDLLKRRFPTWDDLLECPREEVKRIVFSGGLSSKKTASLYGALGKLRETFGACTLEPARDWPDDKLEGFLCGLPEIQRKSAYCIMMYSFGRQVFPADTHVGRVLSRLGVLPASSGRQDTHKKAQQLLLDGRIPGETAFSLHVSLFRHSQEICASGSPQCHRCPLRGFCAEYRERAVKQRESDRDKPSCVHLFSGAGGTSIGISRPVEWGQNSRAATSPTVRMALAAEIDPWAYKTSSSNHPQVPLGRVLLKGLTAEDAVRVVRIAVADEPNLVLVFGGPPPQSVSLIGTTGRKAATAKKKRFAAPTCVAFRDMVNSLRTRFFVMENVPGLFAATDGRAREDIIEDFSDLYASNQVHVEANDRGVPPRRHRILIVGVLKARSQYSPRQPSNSL